MRVCVALLLLTCGSTLGRASNIYTWDHQASQWDTVTPAWIGGPSTIWQNSVNPADTARFFGSGGVVTVNGGIIVHRLEVFSGGYSFLGGPLTLANNGGDIATFHVADAVTTTASSELTGTGLTKTGAGTLILGGANSYTGQTTIEAGTLAISSDSQLGAAGGPLILAGGTLRTTDNLTSSREIVVTADSTVQVDDRVLRLSGPIHGAGGLTFLGRNLGNSEPNVLLTGAGTWSGGTTLRANDVGDLILQVGDGGTTGSLPDGPLLFDTTTYGGTVIFDRNDDHSFGGSLGEIPGGTGVLRLAKHGAGTLTLTGVNTHSFTSINGGTLIVNGGSTLDDTSGIRTVSVGFPHYLTLAPASSTMLGGTGRIVGNARVDSAISPVDAHTIRGDAGSGTGTLTIHGRLIVTASSVSAGRIGVQLDVDPQGNLVGHSKLALTGPNGILQLGTFTTADHTTEDRHVGVMLWNDAGLLDGTNYTVTLATAESGFARVHRIGNDLPITTFEFFDKDFRIFSESGREYTDITADIDGSDLRLSFTPLAEPPAAVPEPLSLTLLAIGGLVLSIYVRVFRARWRCGSGVFIVY